MTLIVQGEEELLPFAGGVDVDEALSHAHERRARARAVQDVGLHGGVVREIAVKLEDVRLLPRGGYLVGLASSLKSPPVDDDAAEGVEALYQAHTSALDVIRCLDKHRQARLWVSCFVSRLSFIVDRNVVIDKIVRPVNRPPLLEALACHAEELLPVALPEVKPPVGERLLPVVPPLFVLCHVCRRACLHLRLSGGVSNVLMRHSP
mmetsp:Transcript_17288/g.39893  ORF Transcript_17288/g.39893 Transcript_17288/m.39893 type:complete len:206 (+) Transcript_17288:1897-2514(+)